MARTAGSVADQTRRRILEAATELFNERGYGGTSIRDITQRLEMTKGALYYHFASKDELLFAMVAPLINGVRAFVDAVRDAGTVRADLVRDLVNMLDANAPLVRSLANDPAVTRAKLEGRGAAAPFAELERAMTGSAGADAFRVRCALGLIFASVLGPPRPERLAEPSCPSRRLTETEKDFVAVAAMAVLAVPVPPGQAAAGATATAKSRAKPASPAPPHHPLKSRGIIGP